MMHGFGMMGGFSLLWLIVPLVLLGAGVATAVLLGRRRRGDMGRDDRRSIGRDAAAHRRLEGEKSGLAGRIFALARENGGELTVSDVVVETGLGPADVESAMNALVDGTHVTMEVDEAGRVRYEFPELRPR